MVNKQLFLLPILLRLEQEMFLFLATPPAKASSKSGSHHPGVGASRSKPTLDL